MCSAECHAIQIVFESAVVECYSEWAGPCKAVVSTLKSLYFAFNDRPIKYYTVSMSATDEQQKRAFNEHARLSQRCTSAVLNPQLFLILHPAGQRRQGEGQRHRALPQQVPASVSAVQGQCLACLLTHSAGWTLLVQHACHIGSPAPANKKATCFTGCSWQLWQLPIDGLQTKLPVQLANVQYSYRMSTAA